MFFSTVPGDYLQKQLSLSLLKVFGQELDSREVAKGQEFAMRCMFDQGSPGQQARPSLLLRNWEGLFKDKVWRQNIKTLTHFISAHSHSSVAWYLMCLCHSPMSRQRQGYDKKMSYANRSDVSQLWLRNMLWTEHNSIRFLQLDTCPLLDSERVAHCCSASLNPPEAAVDSSLHTKR